MEITPFLFYGIQAYDELMLYYIKALNGLGQYYESVNVINQIIDEYLFIQIECIKFSQ
jgi:hypothetical protein